MQMPSSGITMKAVINQNPLISFRKLVSIFLKICRCKHMWKGTKT